VHERGGLLHEAGVGIGPEHTHGWSCPGRGEQTGVADLHLIENPGGDLDQVVDRQVVDGLRVDDFANRSNNSASSVRLRSIAAASRVRPIGGVLVDRSPGDCLHRPILLFGLAPKRCRP